MSEIIILLILAVLIIAISLVKDVLFSDGYIVFKKNRIRQSLIGEPVLDRDQYGVVYSDENIRKVIGLSYIILRNNIHQRFSFFLFNQVNYVVVSCNGIGLSNYSHFNFYDTNLKIDSLSKELNHSLSDLNNDYPIVLYGEGIGGNVVLNAMKHRRVGKKPLVVSVMPLYEKDKRHFRYYLWDRMKYFRFLVLRYRDDPPYGYPNENPIIYNDVFNDILNESFDYSWADLPEPQLSTSTEITKAIDIYSLADTRPPIFQLVLDKTIYLVISSIAIPLYEDYNKEFNYVIVAGLDYGNAGLDLFYLMESLGLQVSLFLFNETGSNNYSNTNIKTIACSNMAFLYDIVFSRE